MNIEDKRAFLLDHCQETPCVKCKLKIPDKWSIPTPDNCLFIADSPEEELDEAIKILNDLIEPENEADKTDDNVEHPSHYTSGGIECIDAIKASMSSEEYKGFLKSQVIKYIWRYRLKGKPTEDLKKARFYLDRLITESEASEND